MTIAMAMPQGNTWGWGVCGTELFRALLAFTGVVYYDPAGFPAGPPITDALPLLQPMEGGSSARPATPHRSISRNVLYGFLEDKPANVLLQDMPGQTFCVGGSSWCANLLREAGLPNVSAIPQGVNRAQFHPMPRTLDRGKFVVFSGGKFEYRKGHDIVIRAVAELMKRYPDIYLLPLWHNPWPQTIRSMAESSLITMPHWWPQVPDDEPHWYHDLLSLNGIPLERIIPLTQPVPHGISMGDLMSQTDCGVFPNRCEGGTNLVLMEYLACGRPAAISANTGHLDVLECVKDLPTIFTVGEDHRILRPSGAVWSEPSLEDTIAHMEAIYCQRPHFEKYAVEQSNLVTAAFSWDAAARAFLRLLTE